MILIPKIATNIILIYGHRATTYFDTYLDMYGPTFFVVQLFRDHGMPLALSCVELRGVNFDNPGLIGKRSLCSFVMGPKS